MNRNFSFAIIALCTIFHTRAQQIQDIDIRDYTIQLTDDKQLNVDITMDLSQLDVKTTQAVVLTPCIVKANDTLALKSIGIYGRNRRIFYLRNAEEKPTNSQDLDLPKSRARGVINYSTSVKFADWMDGCCVRLLRTDYGCCDASAEVSQTSLVDRFPMERYIPQLIYLRPQHEAVKTRQISGSAFVDFPVSDIVIRPTYRNNVAELAKIVGTIDSVKYDKDVTIKSISIKGYASPESPYSNNTYLAKGRTEALKQYVEGLYHFGEGFIKTDYEPEDWAGLERYVMASALPHKEEILQAIRSDRAPDKKEAYIKANWRDEYRHLLEHCYPALRHSDYTIDYEVRAFLDPADIEKVLHTAPQHLSLEEFYILAQTYDMGSTAFNELFETAVRMYPNDPVANLNAANSALLKGDYRSALRHLDKASDLPQAVYTRGVLEVYAERYDQAKPYFEKAKQMGIDQAAQALEEIAKNRNIYKKSK